MGFVIVKNFIGDYVFVVVFYVFLIDSKKYLG